MSFLGLGGKQTGTSTGGIDRTKVDAAEAEIDAVADMFSRLVDVCHKKCIGGTYTDGQLTKSEAVCLDRCVGKYFEVNAKVGESMQSLGQQFAASRR